MADSLQVVEATVGAAVPPKKKAKTQSSIQQFFSKLSFYYSLILAKTLLWLWMIFKCMALAS